MILIGELSLWVALVMAAWATTVSFAGGHLRRAELVASGERALYATFALVLLASIGLWSALLSHDFSLDYVATTTSRNMPAIYVFTAFWGGQAGSMLFWTLVLAIYAAIAVFANRNRARDLMPWVSGTLGAVLLFFLLTTCLGANPYTRLPFMPLDGTGMNPQLQNPGMAIHPPNLYLGYVATTVPFAFAIGALMTRRLDNEWLGAVRRWSLVSWLFLTVGIVLGMWWAYVELGWGGYWAWDPVENASFLPWLTGTAFLHSIMIQEKRGMLRKWNVVLVISTFLLAILGTFITRSGIIESVHAFAQSPVGNWFFGFLVLGIAISGWLVATRLRDLEAPVQLESMMSREAAFLYNNLVLCGIAFSVLWGTLFPIISEWVRGSKITVGPPFFNAVNVPLGLLLLFLTGVGPLIAWRRTSAANLKRQFRGPAAFSLFVGATLLVLGMREAYALVAYVIAAFTLATIAQEFAKGTAARRAMHGESWPLALGRLVARNRRRYGGYVVHLGIVVLFAAFAGMAFKVEHEVSLQPGEKFETTDAWGHRWSFTSQGVSRYESLNRDIEGVALVTTRDGKPQGLITSERRQYRDSRGNPTFNPTTEVGIRSTLKQDVYVVLAGISSGETAELRIAFNPLVPWVWIGGLLMTIGGLIVMWPAAERKRMASGYRASLAPARELVGAPE
ncbi:MAG TPA: heme lyase CcmF/NrfE family subunit [Gemmatimonadaceae bacterium]|nr:heme lyase CcmF/NrfE family subunit [Gemmatimonadaceae bacterium]